MEEIRSKIMLVDDSATILAAGRNALSDNYEVHTMSSSLEMIAALTDYRPDLILLDIEMPEMNGYDAIKIIKSNPETANIPVIFLTGRTDHKSELEGLSLGAVDYIAKPFSPPLLLKRVELHLLVESQKNELEKYNANLKKMVSKKTRSITQLQQSIIRTMAELVEYRDDITGGHIDRTQKYLNILVKASLYHEIYRNEILSWDIKLFLQSAQLHDVGKIAIRDCILLKPGKLTAEEFEEMKAHTTHGVKIIKRIKENTEENDFLNYAEILAGSHHEKWNGSGYPLGIKEYDIPLQGRLMAIADVYDALTNERPYKKAFPHEVAVDIIKNESAKHFDPLLVDIFVKNESEFEDVSKLLHTSTL